MRSLPAVAVLATALASPALLGQTGNIDPARRHAWAENAGWLDFGTQYGGVEVFPDHLEGYVWHENVGWIKLGSGSGPYANTTASDWGVNRNSSNGSLSGFAWAENAGWIRFDPQYGGVNSGPGAVALYGFAWSENLGWIHFQSISGVVYGVAIARPVAVASVSPTFICPGQTARLNGTGSYHPSSGVGIASYTWRIYSGGTLTGALVDVSPAALEMYALTVTDTYGTNSVNLAWVEVSVSPAPTTASVGGPQSVLVNGTTAGLGGNTPVFGTGSWSVVSGGTGTFNPGSSTPNATFTHTGGAGPITLRWTITRGSCTSSAQVAVTILDPQPVTYLTTTSRDGTNVLQWMNPASSPVTPFEIRVQSRTDGSDPSGPLDGTLETTLLGQTVGTRVRQPLSATNGTTYRYGVFTEGPAGLYSPGRFSHGTPRSTSGSSLRWRYATGASALASPGINSTVGGSSFLAVSNDYVLHAMNAVGAEAGEWPAAFSPASMNAASQARPMIAPALTALTGHDRVAFVGAQDGRVYAFDALTGALVTSTGAVAGVEAIQGGVSGTFAHLGGPAGTNRVFFGSRNAVTANVLVARDVAALAIPLWTFDNGGGAGAIGIISGRPALDLSSQRVYFSSRTRSGGSSQTVWCVTFAGAACSGWGPVALGDIDASVSLGNGQVVVGTNAGTAYGLDPATGAVSWSRSTSDGPVKGLVWVDAAGQRAIFSTTNAVWAVSTQAGSAGEVLWQKDLTGLNPSAPLYVNGTVYVGLGNGKVFSIDVTDPDVTSEVTVESGVTVGAPGYDGANGLVVVGTESGLIHAVATPLQ